MAVYCHLIYVVMAFLVKQATGLLQEYLIQGITFADRLQRVIDIFTHPGKVQSFEDRGFFLYADPVITVIFNLPYDLKRDIFKYHIFRICHDTGIVNFCIVQAVMHGHLKKRKHEFKL